MSRPTMRDVAGQAGVSLQTVSNYVQRPLQPDVRRDAGAGRVRTRPARVTGGVWDPADGASMTERLLELDDPPTAIMCGNERIASTFSSVRRVCASIPDDGSRRC